MYSGHNDHNYFEIAHCVKYVSEMFRDHVNLYSFADNHDVEHIYTKLTNKAHFVPVHILLYTLPGIPSIYYGSEFGIEGRKQRYSDDSLRPALKYEDYKNALDTNPCTKLIAALGKIHRNTPALSYGSYKELLLQNTHYAYARILEGRSVIITVNNADQDVSMELDAGNSTAYIGALSGKKIRAHGGRIWVQVGANYGEIWIPEDIFDKSLAPIKSVKNGPVTEYMLGTVRENTHHGSLVTWVKSFI